MNARRLEFDTPTDSLHGVIEPLASTICATRHPPEALRFALKILRAEVEQTHRAARKHVGTFAASR